MPAAAPQPARLVSVDVLRGFTMALMILVNDPGDWAHTYSQLDHAPWNGFTLTDFVFPNFLFLVGVSIILSLRARLARSAAGPAPAAPAHAEPQLETSTRRTLALRILRRAALLFAIKLFLSAYPHFHLAHLRLFGVLTRIALCYLAAALLCLFTQRVRTLAAITAALLIVYWVLMRFVSVPGFGVPTHGVPILHPVGNLAAWIDRGFNAFTRRFLHTGSLYERTRDPEGLLSTLPAIATTLIGCLAGLALTRLPEPRPGLRGRLSPAALLALTGVLSVLGGLAWAAVFPINKNLWTSSYVLSAGGLSLLLLAACHWLFDLRRVHASPLGAALTAPWLIFGANALTAYVLSNFMVETLLAIHLPNPADPAHPLTAWSWPYFHLFAAHGSTRNTSLAFALVFTALCLIPNYLLWRRRIFLRL